MTPAQQNYYRMQLEEMKQVLSDITSGLRNERHPFKRCACGGIHDLQIRIGELDIEEEEIVGVLKPLEHELHLLEEIKGALQRLDQGNFGACHKCSQPISQERLKAIPYTRYCFDCSEKHEGDRSTFGSNSQHDELTLATTYSTGAAQ